MGYFDAIDNKIDKIQESGDIEHYAGNAFWFNIGSFGVFVHAFILTIVFWTQFGSIGDLIAGTESNQGVTGTVGLVLVLALVFVFAVGIFLSVVGLIFNIKAHSAAALIREKSELNSMATSFNILWIVLDIICIILNFVLFAQLIAPSL